MLNSTDFLSVPSSSIRPVFNWTIMDWGYADSTGFSTEFRYCFHPAKPSKYYTLLLPENDTAFWSLLLEYGISENGTFLDIFVSFTNDQPHLFLDLTRSHAMAVSLSQARDGCVEFEISDLTKYELNMTRNLEYMPEEHQPNYHPYNQGYCMDYCIQRSLSNDSVLRYNLPLKLFHTI